MTGRFYIAVCALCFFSSCLFESNHEGYVYQFTNSAYQPSGVTNIFLKQREDIGTDIDSEKFSQDSKGNYSAPFSLSGLYSDRSVIFDVLGNFYPAISFPFTVSSKEILLGGLDSYVMSSLESKVQAPPYNLTINQNGTGKVMIAPNPLGITPDICGPTINDAYLIDKKTGGVLAGSYSKYFFSKDGNLYPSFTAGNFNNIIFFNVPKGDHQIRFTTVDAATTYTEDLVVLDNNVLTFGYEFPCQTFKGFKRDAFQ